ncbi:MAG: hypothetical protein ACOC2Z_12685 [Coleofasciculus sp.]
MAHLLICPSVAFIAFIYGYGADEQLSVYQISAFCPQFDTLSPVGSGKLLLS